jgi:4-hydroxythreonine-4-phosphate dehydrogenase
MKKKPIVIITPGDPAGVGPEVTLKALAHAQSKKNWRNFEILCIGASEPFRKLKTKLRYAEWSDHSGLKLSKEAHGIHFLEAPQSCSKNLLLPGFQSGWSILTAAHLIQTGQAQALVTGPISKERLQKGGFPYFGHTDFLADLCGVDDQFTMMLANDQLRVSLVTTHCSLASVSKELTRPKLKRAVNQTIEFLINQAGISKPRVAVAGLNPHAGEGGLLGMEERKVMQPEIASLQRHWRTKAIIEGPLPADTLFAQQKWGPKNQRFDAVVCMYHDQGLIPVKLLDFPRTVNLTLGLPMIRTSVDHGTAFDIAGKGIADASSMISAITLATRLCRTAKQ